MMPWMRFTQAFDFRPRRPVMIHYPAGTVALVTSKCADQAEAAGKAEPSPKPVKPAKVFLTDGD